VQELKRYEGKVASSSMTFIPAFHENPSVGSNPIKGDRTCGYYDTIKSSIP